MSKGNPKAAVEAWLIATGNSQRLQQMQREGIKEKTRRTMFGSAAVSEVDTTLHVEQSETPVPTEKIAPPLLCFPLAAFAGYSPDLPSDFSLVERTAKGLQSHIRPDGAVFLGLHEVQGEPETGVVVFGPSDTPSGVAVSVSQQYRQEVHALESGRRAALTPAVTQPALIS